MHIFELSIITGLFQTPEYAYKILNSGRPQDEVEALVIKRTDRQQILARKRPPRIVAVFDEMAVRRVISGPEVMRDQYRHLIDLADRHNVTLQIIPDTVGAYAGLPGAFTMLGFDDAPDLVYTEGHVGGQLTEHRPTLQEYRIRYDLIRGAAMSADDSLKLLHAALEGP